MRAFRWARRRHAERERPLGMVAGDAAIFYLT
jgi:hypothetical protein